VRILPEEYSSDTSLEDELQLDGCGLSGAKNMRLVAGFPTRYKSEILPLLEKNQDEIAVLYETQLQNLEWGSATGVAGQNK
jgi:hypothetical protein